MSERLGQRIREIRKARGVSQELLAERLDIPQSSLSRMERGEQKIPADIIEDLEIILQIKLLQD